MVPTQRSSPHAPLLGTLASQRWFTKMGEPYTTQAATTLLRHAELREPLIAWLLTIQQIDLPEPVVAFVAETTDSAGRRPDFIGLDAQGHPRLIIELKFDAKIDVQQIAAYRREQIRHFGTDRSESATLLIVPERRLTKAGDELGRIKALLPEAVREDDLLGGTGFAPWEEWLWTWDSVLDDLPQGSATIFVGCNCNVDLGIRVDLADAGHTPLWLRVRDDGFNDLRAVRSHIAGSRFAATTRADAGHLWIPITVPPHLGDEVLIKALADEALAFTEATRDK